MRGLVVSALLVAVYYIAARLQAFIQYLMMLRLVRLMQDVLR